LRKAFVLDTNVLLFDPLALNKFGNNDLYIPMVVIEEIDRFKREMSENGRHARQLSRQLDTYRKTGGSLSKGVKLPNGSILKVELEDMTMQPLPGELQSAKADNRILAFVMALNKRLGKQPVSFITKDVNLRIKADALEITADDYEPEHVEAEDIYSGVLNLAVDGHLIDEFYVQKKLSMNDQLRSLAGPRGFQPNEYLILKDNNNPTHTAMGRFSKELDSIVPIFKPVEGVWGVFPKNAEQSFALDALLNDEIKLVSLLGKAGTGKTLLAIAAGLLKTVDEGVFQRVLISRPVFPLGKDIGFLPGDIEEKLNPWMQPIYDNIDFLFGNTSGGGGGGNNRGTPKRGAGRGGQELMNQGLISIEPLTYIRGRSIPQQFMIVDEAQNLSPHEIKTIVTRAGEHTKIVLTGDSFQIDNPYVDAVNNGLVYLVEKFKGESISAHVTLSKGERSKLSELASNLL